jgi:hypothetical protein
MMFKTVKNYNDKIELKKNVVLFQLEIIQKYIYKNVNRFCKKTKVSHI